LSTNGFPSLCAPVIGQDPQREAGEDAPDLVGHADDARSAEDEAVELHLGRVVGFEAVKVVLIRCALDGE
jgi:hypothetical protein